MKSKKDNKVYDIDEVINEVEQHIAFLIHIQERTTELLPFGSSLEGVIQDMNDALTRIKQEKSEGRTHMVIEDFQDFIFLERKS